MKINGYVEGISYSRNREMLLTIKLSRRLGEEQLNEIDGFGEKELAIEIKPKSEKRSNTANAYMWALCNDIAEKVDNIGKDDVYRQAVRERGISRDFHMLTEQEMKTLSAAWRQLGIGWLTEPLDYEPDGEHRILRCYYGTSTYNGKQMRKIIDFLEEDARNLNITLISPKEKDLLLDEWQKIKEKEKEKKNEQ